MPFATGYQKDPSKVGSGELYGGSHVVLSATSFENALKIGRFAKSEAGVISNMNNSSTPTFAGVVLRKASNPVESAGTIDNTVQPVADYAVQGLVTVDAITGESPTRGVPVYAYNGATAASFGKATTVSAGNVVANAKFVEAISADVWLVQLA